MKRSRRSIGYAGLECLRKIDADCGDDVGGCLSCVLRGSGFNWLGENKDPYNVEMLYWLSSQRTVSMARGSSLRD